MEDRRNYILQLALELFSEFGFSSTSMRDIAKKGKMALGLTYNYFASKEDILLAIVYEAENDIKIIIREIKKKNDVIEMIDDFFSIIIKKYNFWRLFVQLMLQNQLNQKEFNKIKNIVGEFFFQVEKGFQSFSHLPKNISGVMIHGIIFEYLLTGDKERLMENKKMVLGGF